jgi:two-component system, NtrC family, sensor kinase
VNIYSLSSLLASVSCISVGLFVLFVDRHKPLNRAFTIIASLAGIWTSFPFIISLPDTEATASFLGRIVYMSAYFVPTAFYYLVAVILNVEKRKKERQILQVLILSSLVFAALSFNENMIQGVLRNQPFFTLIPGFLYIPFVLFLSVGTGAAFYKCFSGFRRSSGSKRNQLKYMLLAFIFAFAGAGLHFLVVYLHAEPIPHDFLLIIFAGLITYAIAKHRLMDITVVFQKGLAYGLLMGALIPAYFVILGLVWIFTGTFQYVLSGILVAAFTTFAGLLVSLQKRLQVVVGKALFPQQHNAYDALNDFSTAMRSILDLKPLTERTIAILARALGSAKISLFLLDKEKDEYVLKAAQGVDESQLRAVTITSNHLLPQYLQQMGEAILKEEVQQSNKLGTFSKGISKMLEALECELCLPLQNQGRLMGFVNLGPKPHRAMFTREDLKNLSILAASAASAFANAAFHEQEKEEQRRERHDERAHAFETIAGGFAHEIRNPLVSINTFLQLVPLRKDDVEFMDEFRKVAMNDSARIERLSGEVLGFARLHEPQRHEENLNDVVASSLRAVEDRAQKQRVTLVTELAGDLPLVWIDSQQILQVLGNLIINALDAMEKQKGGQLITRTRRLAKPEGVWVQFEITDSGCGMPPDTLEKIFVPFFTTKHESKEREGTGLGLPICQRIIVAHGGYIEVKSELGKSTTFSVNLPLRQSPTILQATA